MFAILALVSSLFLAHGEITERSLGDSAPAQQSPTREPTAGAIILPEPYFTIHRVEAQNRAIIASKQANTVAVGEEFTIETPYGDCHLPVTKVIEDYFYVDTQQCQSEFVSKGTPLHSTRKVQVVRTPAQAAPLFAGSEITESTDPEWMQSEFYQNFIKNRASAYVSYYTGNTLDGNISYSNTEGVGDLKGSNAIGIGLDYKIADIPYNMDVVGGFAYALPRSYGSYYQSTPAASGRVDFNQNPELEIASLYFDLRYNFNDKVFGLFGVNRLFTRLSKMRGDMTGDIGFHLGARYYPTERLKRFFVNGDINFYNMNYEYQSTKADFSLTELEIKAGYTF